MTSNKTNQKVEIALVSVAILFLLLFFGLVVALWLIGDSYGYVNVFGITIRRWLTTLCFIISSIICVQTVRSSSDKKKLILFSLVAFILLFLPFIPLARHQWIKRQISRLETISPDKNIQLCEPSVQDDGTIDYYVSEGLIYFYSTGWVYMVTHSFHDDNFGMTSIGDISLAIDNEGHLYQSGRHVCGVFGVYTDSSNGVENIDHFLELTEMEKINR